MGTPESELEFCIECSNLVEELNEFTGWCNECTKLVMPTCPNCGRPSIGNKLCSHCKYILWLTKYADDIERAMATQGIGFSVRKARRIIAEATRPKCYSCGNPIKGGSPGKHFFCTKNPECVKAHNVYEYQHRTKPHGEALILAVTASTIYKLTANISNRR